MSQLCRNSATLEVTTLVSENMKCQMSVDGSPCPSEATIRKKISCASADKDWWVYQCDRHKGYSPVGKSHAVAAIEELPNMNFHICPECKRTSFVHTTIELPDGDVEPHGYCVAPSCGYEY